MAVLGVKPVGDCLYIVKTNKKYFTKEIQTKRISYFASDVLRPNYLLLLVTLDIDLFLLCTS